MSRKQATALVFFFVAAGLALQVWYWPQLPDRVATHFGKNGDPDDWMSKPAATALECALVIVIPTFFLLLTRMIRSLPPTLINVPNREYWFAPERREQSFDSVEKNMNWFAVAIAAFLVVVNHLTFVANRDSEALNVKILLCALAAFLVVTLGVVISMFRRFRLPASNNHGAS